MTQKMKRRKNMFWRENRKNRKNRKRRENMSKFCLSLAAA